MNLGYVIALKVLLLVLGVWWCKDVFGRFRSDLEVVKTSRDGGHKAVIIFWWGGTLVILLIMAVIAYSTIRDGASLFIGWG